MSTQPDSPSAGRGVRWWPAAAILLLAAGAWVWIWWIQEAPARQQRVMQTMLLVPATFVLLVLWLLLFSRLRWRLRLGVFAVVAVLVAAAAFTLELRSFSGDVVPHFAFKWSPKQDPTLTTELPAAAGAAPAGDAGGDFPQFLGPQRNATVGGLELARDWQAEPPEELWRRPIGAGHSGFAVAGGIAVTHEQRGEREMVVAYDLLSGAVLWSHGVEARYESPLAGDGPRATPAIAGDTVYALGATGILSALDLRRGELRWSADLLAGGDAKMPAYGFSGSPLVLDDVVVVVAGGDGRALRAYDRTTGELRWAAGSYDAAYASPLVATIAGVRQIVVFNQQGLTGHALDGAVLWQTPWPSSTERASQPVPLPGDRLFVSSGYGVGGKLFQLRRDDAGTFHVDLLWESTKLKTKFTQAVYRDGYLYGLDDGILACVDVATGERAWKGGRYGHGQILLVGDLILVSTEKGEVALVEARPDAYVELARIPAIEGKTWNNPALAGPYLLVRNSQEAACFKLPARRLQAAS